MRAAVSFVDIRRFVLVAWADLVAQAFCLAVSAFAPTLCAFVPAFTDHRAQAIANDCPTPAGMQRGSLKATSQILNLRQSGSPMLD